MDPGHISSDHYAAYTGVASGQSPVTLHHNVPRSHLAPGEQARRASDSQVTEMTEKNKEHQASFHRQAMMNAFSAVATPGGNLRPAVSPRQLSPPNYAFVQPSENEHLKRQIEERIKELAQKHEELKAADKRAALTDAKAAAAVALAKEKNQQLMEDLERAKDKAEALKKELDEKEALIGELTKENDEILQRMDEQHPSTDIAEGVEETIAEPPNNNMAFMHVSESHAARTPSVGPSEANAIPAYQSAYIAQPAYLPYNYTNYWPYPMPPQ